MSEYTFSRGEGDYHRMLPDVAFLRHSTNEGQHVSPFDNGKIQIGRDGIKVELVQGIDEQKFKRVIGMATRATIGIDLNVTSVDETTAEDDWEEMMRGGLQTALESAVIVFAVSGVSRTCTHQIVRSRRAAFHQQSQRANYYGDRPEARMPDSVFRNERARQAWVEAKAASDKAYRIACEEDIGYQDARYVLLEATDNYIMCEYSVREFLKVYEYRACSMFSWEITHVMHLMRLALIKEHPWMTPYVKIGCENTPPVDRVNPQTGEVEHFDHSCTFQGWENVEGQCGLPWAKEHNRTFQPTKYKIKSSSGEANKDG